jgi:hypothetical protein
MEEVQSVNHDNFHYVLTIANKLLHDKDNIELINYFLNDYIKNNNDEVIKLIIDENLILLAKYHSEVIKVGIENIRECHRRGYTELYNIFVNGCELFTIHHTIEFDDFERFTHCLCNDPIDVISYSKLALESCKQLKIQFLEMILSNIVLPVETIEQLYDMTDNDDIHDLLRTVDPDIILRKENDKLEENILIPSQDKIREIKHDINDKRLIPSQDKIHEFISTTDIERFKFLYKFYVFHQDDVKKLYFKSIELHNHAKFDVLYKSLSVYDYLASNIALTCYNAHAYDILNNQINVKHHFHYIDSVKDTKQTTLNDIEQQHDIRIIPSDKITLEFFNIFDNFNIERFRGLYYTYKFTNENLKYVYYKSIRVQNDAIFNMMYKLKVLDSYKDEAKNLALVHDNKHALSCLNDDEVNQFMNTFKDYDFETFKYLYDNYSFEIDHLKHVYFESIKLKCNEVFDVMRVSKSLFGIQKDALNLSKKVLNAYAMNKLMEMYNFNEDIESYYYDNNIEKFKELYNESNDDLKELFFDSIKSHKYDFFEVMYKSVSLSKYKIEALVLSLKTCNSIAYLKLKRYYNMNDIEN